MNRIFGTKKAPAPAPSLGDASSRVDSRVAAVDSKIRTLDNELREHKEALKKAKGGAAQRIKKRCFDVLRRKRMCVTAATAAAAAAATATTALLGCATGLRYCCARHACWRTTVVLPPPLHSRAHFSPPSGTSSSGTS